MKKAISRKNIWNSTPAFVKSTIGRLLEPIPPAWLLGKTFRDQKKLALDAQWWPAERAHEFQLNKLCEILNLAYHKTEFYRSSFDSAGFHPDNFQSLENMHCLPIITKQVVADKLSQMCIKSVRDNDVDYISTGGTSGTPLYFYLDAKRSSVEYAYLITSWERAGYKLGMPMAVLRGQTVRINRKGLHHEYDPILRHHYYSSFHMSDENMANYLRHMASIGPCFLHAYPSTVFALARFILRNGTHASKNIQGIITESEIVYPKQRQMVEEVFGCRCFSCYGQSEKLVLATECEQSDNYHIWPTYGHFELLDDEGHPVTASGQRGEIVGTGFISTVMPLIRYRTGDWATYVGDRCASCGREHTIIKDIRGHRIQEFLIAADNSEISWTALNMHDDTFMHVRQFQFFQDTQGQAVLRIVPADGFADEDADRIYRNMGRKLGSRLTFTIELVDEIPLTARGKAIYVDQRIDSSSEKARL